MSPSSASPPPDPGPNADPSRRLRRSFRFADPDMDLFFMAALGWGASGGLDVGQAFYVAERIDDGDADGWVRAFTEQGDRLFEEADAWLSRRHTRNAAESRLKAFAAWRSAWQFAGPGDTFARLINRQHAAFVQALTEFRIRAAFFETPWAGGSLPGVFLPAADPGAPLALIVGGADTSFEDLFLTLGRNLLERGYAVALADLPGQGLTQARGLFWEEQAEAPTAAVIDVLIADHGARAGSIALIGLSLGGYFVARAAGHDTRLRTVIASTPLPNPADLFARSVAAAGGHEAPAGSAARRSRDATFWKAGVTTAEQFVERTRGMVADPARVALPFLSIVGAGESDVFREQAEWWHRTIPATRKRLVRLDAASGADGHCQTANRLRLAQECAAWIDEIFDVADRGPTT